MTYDATLVDAGEMRELLRAFVAEAGSQVTAAQKLRVSPQFICMVLRGKKPVSAAIAKRLGFKRLVVFIEEAGNG